MSKNNIEDIYTLSPLQQGLLFHSLYSTESDAYLQQLRFSIRGKLNVPVFEAAWQQVIARHTILRTAFIWDRHEKLLQAVRKQVKLPWLELDWRALPPEEQHEHLAAWLKEDRRRGFDLSKAPLLRMTVIRLADESYELYCTLHHLLTDGWSTAILIKELFAFYNASCEGLELNLERPRPYRDYIEWLQHQDILEAELFWREMLKGFTAPTPLIGDAEPARLSETDENIEIQRAWLSPATTEKLQAMTRRLGITLNTLVLGAWAILLGRYSDEEDVVFGVTVSGRPASLAGVEAMVGLFINTLPMRVQLSRDARLLPWLEWLQTRLLEVCEYEYSPLAQVQGFSDVPRGVPLFESMLVFENYPLEDATQGLSRHLESVSIHSLERSSYPLGLVAAPGPKLYLQIGYDSRRFSFDTVSRMLGHLEAVLESMLASPDQRLADLSLLTTAERQQLLIAWNGSVNQVATSKCLHQLFEEQVERTPEAIAVIFEDERLTYRELNNRANQLAHYLRDHGVGPEAHVGICVERSLEMIVGILGIIKAGAAYVPMDPGYPVERLNYILEDAQIRILLTQQALLERLPEREAQVVRLDADWEAIARYPEQNPLTAATGDNIAYVIYTSGSTGQPKGVLITHEGICNTLLWRRQAFSLNDEDRILQNLSFAFDASVWQIFGALLNGGQLILARPEYHRDTAYLIETMIEHAITITDFPPSMLRALLSETGVERCSSLRHVFCGGEAMSDELQERFFARFNAELHNVYGPTETSVDATCWTCQRKENRQIIPIGRPINNKQIYLLDSQLQPVPVGVEGEICIGGSGLARGYLNRPDATSEKFISHPFSTEPGARLYKTGDIGRFLPDGNIEFLRRNDQQVKIRGFRIELGEVEAALAQHAKVKQAVAVARQEESGEKRLVAYVVGRRGESCTSQELRRYMQERLPSYMVPSSIVLLDEMPVTSNGKLDRRALPAPELNLDKSDFVAPRTRTEEILCGVWAKVLRVDQVGVDDNFFELGGDSILSIQVCAQAREAGLHLTPRHLFEHQTIANLADVAAQGTHIKAEQGLVSGAVPLTPIQHEFFEWGLATPHHYYQAVLLELATEIDSSLLERALGELLRQHDVLRLRFKPEKDVWKQTHAITSNESPLSRKDFSRLEASEQKAALEEDAGQVQASLNLEHGPLFRAVEYDFGAGKGRRLLLVIHHLVVDGVSWRILLDDLQRAYEQLRESGKARLPAKTTSFKAWAERLNEYGRSQELRQEIPYWLAQERKANGNLPVDHRLGENSVGSAQTFSVTLNADETRALLQEVPSVYHTQINDLLLTTLVQTFERWTGEGALLVALEGHGREEIFEDVDLSRTVGWFTTIFPVLLQLREAMPPGRALQEIKEQLRRIPQRGLGYGLLRYVSGDADTALRLKLLPPAEVSFNYLGQFDQVFSGSELFAVAKESSDWSQDSEGERQHLLDVVGMVFDGCLRLNWTYSENLHQRETIERLAGWYLESLQELTAHCRSPEAGGFTPSDFPLAHLDQQTLDERLGSKGQIVDIYPLSPMQEGLLFHWLYAPESKAYFLQASCRIDAALDVTAFLRAWQTVVDRHAILRTSFLWEGLPKPLQVVHERVNLEWMEGDWREQRGEEQAANWEDFLRQDRERGFELSESPLMRFALMRTGIESYYFAWSTHHILLDGWSNQFVMNEMLMLYEAYSQGRELQLKQLPQYRDYIAWLQRQDLGKAEAFWREELRGFTEPTSVGIDRGARGLSEGDEEYEEQAVALPEEVTSKLESLARAYKVTLNTMVQGAWGLLLSRYSGTDDVVFGATSSGRTAGPKGIEAMVGLFINTLPVRVRVRPEETLRTFLKELQVRQSRAQEYEFSPLLQVQGWSEAARGRPLFESLLVFENYPINASLGESGSALLQVREAKGFERTHYALALTALPGRKLRLMLEYERKRFERESVARLLCHLRTLLEGMARVEAECRLRDLPMLSEAEREQMLVEWNRAEVEHPAEKRIHELFAEQVERTPRAAALAFEGEELSYQELNRRANRLAHYLKRLGVGPEVPVGLCVERSFEMVIGLLGILKAGGTYVPLDPAYPQERLAYMLDDAKIEVLLTQERLKTKLPDNVATLVQLDVDGEAIAKESESNPALEASPLNLAYVIYTSGSTGQPKGVAVPHGVAASHIASVKRRFGYQEDDRVLQFASFNFDVSLEQIFATLFSGAMLVIKDSQAWGRAEFHRVAQSVGLTVADIPPAYLLQLIGEDESNRALPSTLRLIIVGGDSMPVEAVRRWRRIGMTDMQLVNAYGPTEAVITATLFKVENDEDGRAAVERVPIGRPLAGRTAYILDPQGSPSPIGVWGELFLGGRNLARGYLNRPAQTAEMFVPDPFSAEAGSRLYRTGDVARYLADGNIEFLGRNDQQVKIRGFRIELGEVEAALSQHGKVEQAAAVVREQESGEKRLVAYVVSRHGESVTGAELRSYVEERLPSYMLPSAIVLIDEMPLTSNGKVDRRALPSPASERVEAEHNFVAPRDFVEVLLLRIWEDVLGIKPIGIKDDFFELGGHSILAVRLMSEIQKQFGRELALAILFEKRTIEQLSDALRQQFETLPDSPLVPIQPLGTRWPLFFVHVGSGQVLCYLELARYLGTEQPFYGLQDTNRYEAEPDGSVSEMPISEMAAYYIDSLRAVQPEGPYILGGWSFGGLVAYEMALQLTERGEKVPLLILLDTATPDFIHDLSGEDDASLLAILAQEMSLPVSNSDLRPLDAEAQLRYVTDEMEKAHLIFDDSRAYLKRQLETFKSRVRAINQYYPKPYSGRIVFFSAGEMTPESEATHLIPESTVDPTRGFGKLATGSLELYTVPGHHHQIARGESARILAEMLRSRLDREMQQELVMETAEVNCPSV